MTDRVLEKYRREAARRTDLTFPKFADEAVHTAPVLAVLESPGNSGAQKSGTCSLDNPDPTARRQVRIIKDVGLKRHQIVLWNFYAAYEVSAYKTKAKDRNLWANELEKLVSSLPNLKVVIAFGDYAWRGMRDVRLPNHVLLIGAPHPSDRSCNSNPDAETRITRAWQRTKACLH